MSLNLSDTTERSLWAGAFQSTLAAGLNRGVSTTTAMDDARSAAAEAVWLFRSASNPTAQEDAAALAPKPKPAKGGR